MTVRYAIAFVFLMTAAVSAQESEYDFRQVRWGMSAEQVTRSEREQGSTIRKESAEEIICRTEMGGFPVSITYYFRDGAVYNALLVFLQKHSNKNLFVDDFRKLHNVLMEKYGQPVSDEKEWSNDLFRDNPDREGLAIAAGHLKYVTFWRTGSTSVLLLLTGDNYRITFAMSYRALGVEDEKTASADGF